ncbi:MAG: glycosyltransferase family 2 protein [Bacillota bacterium]|nr:glycosyltransferase family 2 protein [Bacillota bacterium]
MTSRLTETAAVIIPAYQEADRIGETLRALRAAGFREIWVVDDGSTDATARRAREAGARLLRFARNRGKGAALTAGLNSSSGDPILFLDADLGESAAEAVALLAPLEADEADMAVAAFPGPARGAGLGFVVGLARWGIRRLTGWNPRFPVSGQRALRRSLARAIAPFAPGFGVEVAMTVRALWRGARIREVPVAFRHRRTGRDLAGWLHRGRQLRDVAWTLLGLALERKRPAAGRPRRREAGS